MCPRSEKWVVGDSNEQCRAWWSERVGTAGEDVDAGRYVSFQMGVDDDRISHHRNIERMRCTRACLTTAREEMMWEYVSWGRQLAESRRARCVGIGGTSMLSSCVVVITDGEDGYGD